MPLGTPPPRTVGFNMPMGKPAGEFAAMAKGIQSQVQRVRKVKAKVAEDKANAEAAANSEKQHEAEARGRGMTDAKKEQMGFETWTDANKWHKRENANIERARERARMKKGSPGLKEDRAQAAKEKAAAKAKASDVPAPSGSSTSSAQGKGTSPDKMGMATPEKKGPADKAEEPAQGHKVFLGNTIPVHPTIKPLPGQAGTRPAGSIRGAGGKYESNPEYAPAMARAARFQGDMANQAIIQGAKPDVNPMNLPKIRRTMARPNPTNKTGMGKIQAEANQTNALRNTNLNNRQAFPKQ